MSSDIQKQLFNQITIGCVVGLGQLNGVNDLIENTGIIGIVTDKTINSFTYRSFIGNGRWWDDWNINKKNENFFITGIITDLDEINFYLSTDNLFDDVFAKIQYFKEGKKVITS